MLLEQKIKSINLTKNEQIIADYIIEHKYQLKNLSTRDIALATYTSSAGVIRLAKKLSYSGFNELKEDYLSELDYINQHFKEIDANFPFTANQSIMDIAEIMSTLMQETARDTLHLIKHDPLMKATRILQQSSTIYFYATSGNFLLAQNFKLKMIRIGKKVEVDDLDTPYSSLLITQNDCAIIISYSGQTPSLIKIAKNLKNKKIPVIVITSIGENTLSESADCVLQMTTREKMYSKISNFTTEYSLELLLNILYSCFFKTNYNLFLDYKISNAKQIEHRGANSNIIKEE